MNKKYLCIIFMVCFIPALLFGMVINTNQSAEYIRMMNRNASTDLDAALYNPAGLTQLEDGLFLYLSSQTIWQSRTVKAAFPAYNSDTFEGKTFVPTFPNAYFAYKKAKLAFFGGFMPIGGGGSAEFPKGLPLFDRQLAQLVGLPATTLITKGLPQDIANAVGTINGYSVDAAFNGSSIYFAGQGGAAYQVNKLLSVALGLRYVYALNTYEGSLKNAVLKAEHRDIPGFIPDMSVDSKRTGSGITGLIGLNIVPWENLNIGLRYEHITKLKMEADTKKDDTKLVFPPDGMFPDGAVYNEDIPGQFGAGIGLNFPPKLKLQVSFNYFLNTQCNWDGDEEKVTNDLNTGVGLEYQVIDALSASIGYLFATTGATDEYQTDLDYSLASNTIGAGIKYALNENLDISVATSNTFYIEGHNDDVGTIFEEKYQKTAFVIAFGIQYKF